MKTWVVFIIDKVENDIKKGDVGYKMGPDSFLERIRTSNHGDICVFQSEFICLNGIPLFQRLNEALNNYWEARNLAINNNRIRNWAKQQDEDFKRNVQICKRLLQGVCDSLAAMQNATQELKEALVLLDYFKEHKVWYPNAEDYFFSHIGRTVLMIWNVSNKT
jgi:hypothetical protein